MPRTGGWLLWGRVRSHRRWASCSANGVSSWFNRQDTFYIQLSAVVPVHMTLGLRHALLEATG